MSDLLERIAGDRRKGIEALKLETPGHVLRSRLGSAPPAGRLERALRRGPASGPIHLICEIKRASPSRGVLKADLDPVAQAKVYAEAGASAISIVTEPDHFQGDLAWVPMVRETVDLPILLKDFIVDPYQLVDAAHRGADGVLLLSGLLSDVQLQRYIMEARLLGLDSLVEVHDLRELQIALRAGATIVGINNRDLHTFKVDPQVSYDLIGHVPELVTAVAESGFREPGEIARLRGTRCDAVLIGEALVTSSDPAALVASLRQAARGSA